MRKPLGITRVTLLASAILSLVALATTALPLAGCGGCPDTQTSCAGRCVSLQSDVLNCGVCNKACAAGQTCSMGRCVLTCQSGFEDCSGTCRDLQSDRLHCGACGKACADGEVCSGGKCGASCRTGLTPCDGTCRDLQSDVGNCGACGKKCDAGQVCSSGTCAVSCQTGLTNCSGACRDLQTDVLNCGACGKRCDAGQVCSAGTCAVSCQAGLTLCDGSCRDLQTDNANCGACATSCDAGKVCRAGTCVVSCQTGLTNCNGTCRDLQTDVAHCGGCGKACPSGQVCTGGACAATCSQGQTICSGQCTNLAYDPNNCGACAKKCDVGTNSVAACAAGTCVLVCATGYNNCDSNPQNGCEASALTDPKNCGGCGVVCPSGPNAQAACSGGKCGLQCGAGFADCDNNAANGCEVGTQGDVNNCGGCGTKCPSGANATASCSAGRCNLACAGGYANCDGNPATGCEVSTTNDRNNCGMCGTVCQQNQVCANGVCAVFSDACTFRQAEHPAYTTPNRDVALCGNTYTSSNIRTACAVGWHVCLLAEWNARFPRNAAPNGALTSWGDAQSARCTGGVWEANRPVNGNIWSGNVCTNPYNPWNSGKFLFADDNATILQGSGSCCSWDSTFSTTSTNANFAVYCCR